MATKKVLGRGLGAFFPEYQEEGKEKEGVEKSFVKPEDRVNIVLFVPVDHIRNSSAPKRI